MLGARPFALAEDPVLRSGADKIAAKLGVRAPELYLIDDGFPRLFAVGRGPSSSTLAISVGALRSLRREELEAAMAHELAHVRRRDVLVQTFVVLFATTLWSSAASAAGSRAFCSTFLRPSAQLRSLLLSPKRELHADALAATAPARPTISRTR